MKIFKKLSLFFTMSLTLTLILVSTTIYASDSMDNELKFNTEFVEDNDLPITNSEAILVKDTHIQPFINDDGTLSFETSGKIGETLVSSTFKFTKSTSKLTLTASGDPSSYHVYLEKKGTFKWSQVKDITFYTGGTYEYTFSDLSTSGTYRLRFYSPDGKVKGTGSISNYSASK